VHADHDELIDWIQSANTAPKTIYLVHGEPSGAEELHDAIEAELDVAAVVPTYLERVRLG
jgi:metallo-beta-lactamase family protein